MILILMRPLSFSEETAGVRRRRKRGKVLGTRRTAHVNSSRSRLDLKKRRREKLRNGESDAMSSTENGENKPLLLLLMVSLYVYNILQEIEDKRGKK
jgi:hypothetical protein